jgi:Mg2+/Co2+ transporter CorC
MHQMRMMAKEQIATRKIHALTELQILNVIILMTVHFISDNIDTINELMIINLGKLS